MFGGLCFKIALVMKTLEWNGSVSEAEFWGLSNFPHP